MAGHAKNGQNNGALYQQADPKRQYLTAAFFCLAGWALELVCLTSVAGGMELGTRKIGLSWPSRRGAPPCHADGSAVEVDSPVRWQLAPPATPFFFVVLGPNVLILVGSANLRAWWALEAFPWLSPLTSPGTFS